MADNKSGPAEAVKGVVEDVKGRVKEAVGAVAGRDDLTREGQAQQDKAEAQRDAAKKEAEAEAARGAAKVAEERQKSNRVACRKDGLGPCTTDRAHRSFWAVNSRLGRLEWTFPRTAAENLAYFCPDGGIQRCAGGHLLMRCLRGRGARHALSRFWRCLCGRTTRYRRRRLRICVTDPDVIDANHPTRAPG